MSCESVEKKSKVVVSAFAPASVNKMFFCFICFILYAHAAEGKLILLHFGIARPESAALVEYLSA